MVFPLASENSPGTYVAGRPLDSTERLPFSKDGEQKMNITRFAVHVVSCGTLVATVTGQTHVVGQFAPHIGELVSGFEGSHMKNAVDQSDTRRIVIPAGHKLEIVITPMCSAMGGV